MADLVSVTQAADFIGGLDAVDETLKLLVDAAEAMFEAECGRQDVPFQLAQAGRVERLDGTVRDQLFLDYPVKVLTSVKLGYDLANPDETLVVNDQTVLVWSVGSPRLVRNDHRSFAPLVDPAGSSIIGSLRDPRRLRFPGYVTVTYDTADDLPADAGLAVLRGVAAIHRQRGAEDVSMEAIGGYRADLLPALEGDPVWQRAVAAHRRIRL
jgi:hypothetical protein